MISGQYEITEIPLPSSVTPNPCQVTPTGVPIETGNSSLRIGQSTSHFPSFKCAL